MSAYSSTIASLLWLQCLQALEASVFGYYGKLFLPNEYGSFYQMSIVLSNRKSSLAQTPYGDEIIKLIWCNMVALW